MFSWKDFFFSTRFHVWNKNIFGWKKNFFDFVKLSFLDLKKKKNGPTDKKS